MSSAERLNPGLFGVHRIFFVLYVGFGIILTAMVIYAAFEPGSESDGGAFGILALIVLFQILLAVAHGYAAKGAKLGMTYGRTLSRIIGVLWLFGIPLGTILGIYVLVKASDKHWKSADRQAPPTSANQSASSA